MNIKVKKKGSSLKHNKSSVWNSALPCLEQAKGREMEKMVREPQGHLN